MNVIRGPVLKGKAVRAYVEISIRNPRKQQKGQETTFCSMFYIHPKAPYTPIAFGRSLLKCFIIQRRLAWSLCKDDTQNRREAILFFWFPSCRQWSMFVLLFCFVVVCVSFCFWWISRNRAHLPPNILAIAGRAIVKDRPATILEFRKRSRRR